MPNKLEIFNNDIFEVTKVSKDPNWTVTSHIPDIDEHQLNDKYGIDIESKIYGVLINEISQGCCRKVISEAFKETTSKYDIESLAISNKREGRLSEILDNSDKVINKPDNLMRMEIFQELITENTNTNKFIITNGSVGVDIQDLYTFKTNEGVKAKLILHNTGSIMGCSVYIDAFMRYNDNRLAFLGDKIKIFLSEPIITKDKDRGKIEIFMDYELPNIKIIDLGENTFGL